MLFATHHTATMKKLLICIGFLLFSAVAAAQALWQEVPAGASPAEVRALVPEAQPLPFDAASKDEVVKLEVANYELAGTPFKVSFVFKSDQLTRITLRANAGSADAARALAQSLTTSLRSRYGLEMSTRSRGSTSSVTIDRQWNFRRTVIHLQVMDVSFVSLEYSAQAPTRSPRL